MCLPPPEPTDEQVEQHNKATINYLKQLLPVAWSHNSLTTLKLSSISTPSMVLEKNIFRQPSTRPHPGSTTTTPRRYYATSPPLPAPAPSTSR
ncbi:uncharacterized protein Pyn_23832 [Prunus yedoensis var. nudiflora]|uniref:Uncharacterized protein n=1 Tax=Prunus yedoensis var. nudiflora TaxID=2094558 RepID=A0A314ZBK4_PRUYE|nr:uncharacterized protein Pyn_23832 [Prunus yedoensis var. nudiflora]